MRIPVQVLTAETDEFEEFDHPLGQFASAGFLVDGERSANDVAYEVSRVQRCVRVLEDHLAVASKPARRLALEQVDAISASGGDVCVHASRGRFGEACDQASERGLATPTLAYQPQRGSPRNVEAHAVERPHLSGHSLHDPILDGEMFLQVTDRDQWILSRASGRCGIRDCHHREDLSNDGATEEPAEGWWMKHTAEWSGPTSAGAGSASVHIAVLC